MNKECSGSTRLPDMISQMTFIRFYMYWMVIYILSLSQSSPNFYQVMRKTEFQRCSSSRFSAIIGSAILLHCPIAGWSPAAGALILQFIKDELIPYISGHYRTAPYRILAAHSLGGLFALYAKESEPDLFQAEILMSPAFYGPNKKILLDCPSFLKRADSLSGNMFITIGDEAGAKGRIDTLAGFLKKYAPSDLHWSYRTYPEDDHFSLPFTSIYDGLKFIYDGFFTNIWDDQHLPTRQAITEHFHRLSAKFGYPMTPGEEFVNNCGYKQLRMKQYDQAIALFELNVENHPKSWNAYDSMGEAYMDAGNTKLAIENYKKSISINPNNANGKEKLKKMDVR